MVKILILYYLCFYLISGLHLSVNPSPNISTLQSAVYQCAEDVVVPLTWFINETISSASSSFLSYISNYSIIVDGVGTQNTSLIIPGDPILNTTTVRCEALGFVNNMLHHETTSYTLFIQDAPASVNLNCSHHSACTIQCTWSVPYTLPGVDITGYNIYISNETSDLIMMTAVNEIEYTYIVCDFGNYTVTVTALIGELRGVIDSVEICEDNVSCHDFNCFVSHSLSTVDDSTMTISGSTGSSTYMLKTIGIIPVITMQSSSMALPTTALFSTDVIASNYDVNDEERDAHAWLYLGIVLAGSGITILTITVISIIIYLCLQKARSKYIISHVHPSIGKHNTDTTANSDVDPLILPDSSPPRSVEKHNTEKQRTADEQSDHQYHQSSILQDTVVDESSYSIELQKQSINTMESKT